MASFITLAELNVLTNTNLSATHDTAYLNGIITSVSDHVETYCMGTLFTLTDLTDERHRAYVRARPPHPAKLRIKTNYVPLNSVSSVKYKVGSTETTISIDEMELIEAQGIFEMLWYFPLWRVPDDWIVLITYNAGFSSIPHNVKMATALLVREWVDYDDSFTGGTRGDLKSFRIGSYAEEYFSKDAGASGNLGLGTPLSQRARQLLAKYRRPGVARGDR